jgi:hypothetical protein
MRFKSDALSVFSAQLRIPDQEQDNATAAGVSSVAFNGNSTALGNNSLVAGRGATAVGHSFSMVFGDGQPGQITSTMANQFLVRAQWPAAACSTTRQPIQMDWLCAPAEISNSCA